MIEKQVLVYVQELNKPDFKVVENRFVRSAAENEHSVLSDVMSVEGKLPI